MHGIRNFYTMGVDLLEFLKYSQVFFLKNPIIILISIVIFLLNMIKKYLNLKIIDADVAKFKTFFQKQWDLFYLTLFRLGGCTQRNLCLHVHLSSQNRLIRTRTHAQAPYVFVLGSPGYQPAANKCNNFSKLLILIIRYLHKISTKRT